MFPGLERDLCGCIWDLKNCKCMYRSRSLSDRQSRRDCLSCVIIKKILSFINKDSQASLAGIARGRQQGQAYSASKTAATRSEQGETWENVDRYREDRKTASGGRGIGKIAIGLGIGLAMGIFAGRMGRTPPPANPESLAAQPAAITTAPSQTVTVAPVETGAIARTISATGTVAAYDLLPLLPQANYRLWRFVRSTG